MFPPTLYTRNTPNFPCTALSVRACLCKGTQSTDSQSAAVSTEQSNKTEKKTLGSELCSGEDPEEVVGDEWQEYIDEKTNQRFYVNLRTQYKTWNKPKWYLPAESIESPAITLLRSDRLDPNPYRKPSRRLILINAVVAVICIVGLGYEYWVYKTQKLENVDDAVKKIRRRRRKVKVIESGDN